MTIARAFWGVADPLGLYKSYKVQNTPNDGQKAPQYSNRTVLSHISKMVYHHDFPGVLSNSFHVAVQDSLLTRKMQEDSKMVCTKQLLIPADAFSQMKQSTKQKKMTVGEARDIEVDE